MFRHSPPDDEQQHPGQHGGGAEEARHGELRPGSRGEPRQPGAERLARDQRGEGIEHAEVVRELALGQTRDQGSHGAGDQHRPAGPVLRAQGAPDRERQKREPRPELPEQHDEGVVDAGVAVGARAGDGSEQLRADITVPPGAIAESPLVEEKAENRERRRHRGTGAGEKRLEGSVGDGPAGADATERKEPGRPLDRAGDRGADDGEGEAAETRDRAGWRSGPIFFRSRSGSGRAQPRDRGEEAEQGGGSVEAGKGAMQREGVHGADDEDGAGRRPSGEEAARDPCDGDQDRH
jgi:hypothetical protein